MGSDGHDAAAVTQQQQQAPPQRAALTKLERWVFLYNVTTGLYMLDWWERCIFNALFLVLFLMACYNSGHYMSRLGAALVAWCGDDAASSFAFGRGIRDGFLAGGAGAPG
jgi:hypothetical protein